MSDTLQKADSTKVFDGMVIFYDVKSGVGQINSVDGTKHSFSHNAVEGLWIPGAGDMVSFAISDPENTEEGLHRVVSVVLKNTLHTSDQFDSMISCPKCHHSVRPHVVMYEGQPDSSYCPDCGAKIADYARNDKVFWLILSLTLIGVVAIAFWSFG